MLWQPNQLTVAIVSYNSSSTILKALEALSEQTMRGFHTLVVDSSTDNTPHLIATQYPNVALHHLPQRHFPGAARNVALAIAHTPLIAFVDADCLAAPDWVARILKAHAAPHLIIGGSVGVANPGNLPGLGSFFTEFTPWLQRGQPRLLPDVPTCCYSFKREAFNRFGPFLTDGYCSDTDFNARAAAAGHVPWFDPTIHVRHINPSNPLRALRKQTMHGRTYASLRARLHAFSRAERIFRFLTAPLLPFLFWLRSASSAFAVPELRWRFLLATPFCWLYFTAWALGEARGYLKDNTR